MDTLPSIQVFEIVAHSDAALFEHMMDSVGLPILGMINRDPLCSDAQCESIEAIASVITEGIHDEIELPPELDEIKRMAEALGFIIGISEAAPAEFEKFKKKKKNDKAGKDDDKPAFLKGKQNKGKPPFGGKDKPFGGKDKPFGGKDKPFGGKGKPPFGGKDKNPKKDNKPAFLKK